MVLLDIIRGIPKRNWLDCVDLLVEKSAGYQLNTQEQDYVCSQLGKWFKVGNAKHASNWLVIGLLFDGVRFTDRMKRTGALRPSRYDFSAGTVKSALGRILASRLDLSASVESYLTSMKNLCTLSDAVAIQLQLILHHLSRHRGMIVRQLLAYVDLLFMLQVTRGLRADRLASEDQVSFYSPEDLAEALSFILYLYHSKIGAPAVMNRIDEADNEVCGKLLVMAAQIRRFRECEILVDSFDYCLSFDPNDNVATLCPPTKEFDTALRLGFIGADLRQRIVGARPQKEEDILSLLKMGQGFYEVVKDKLVRLEEKPFKRYTFRMPVESPLEDILNEESLFAEEEEILEFAGEEWLVPISRLLQFEVSEGLTIWDVVKTQRLFNFLRWYAISHLEPKLEEETDVVLRSLVPSFTKNQILRLLRMVVGDKAPAMQEFLSWDPDGPGVFDLQYQPLVTFDGIVFVPYNLLSNSNLLRNSLKLSGKRLYDDGTIDPPAAFLEHVLQTRTAKTVSNMPWSWNGTNGEVDVMASFDGLLFIFECKNPLAPGNVFELRTSYDHILTASDQLDAFRHKRFLSTSSAIR